MLIMLFASLVILPTIYVLYEPIIEKLVNGLKEFRNFSIRGS